MGVAHIILGPPVFWGRRELFGTEELIVLFLYQGTITSFDTFAHLCVVFEAATRMQPQLAASL